MTKVRLFWRNGWAYACWQEAVPVKASEQKKRPYRTRWRALKTQDKTEAAQRLQGVKKELKAGKIKPITDGIR